MTQDTGPAKLPAIPPIPPGVDPALRRVLEALKERAEVREGSRGNPYEQVVTRRDLAGAGLSLTPTRRRLQPGEFEVDLGNGLTAGINVAQFAESIRSTRLFNDLTQRIDSPERFNRMADEVKEVLLRRIADEAAARGAALRRTETLIQDANRSLAMVVSEVTAALGNNQAGIRELQMAYVTETTASAAQVTQLEARIDGAFAVDPALLVATEYATLAALDAAVTTPDPSKYYKVTNPDVQTPVLPALLYRWAAEQAVPDWVLAGLGGSARMEEVMRVSADRATGLEAQYTLKVDAGGAVAGIGLAATSDVAGAGTSAILLRASKLAFLSAEDVVGTEVGEVDPVNPDLSRVPFGVDASGVYINGTLRVNASGLTLDELTTDSGVYLGYSSQFFKYDTAGAVVNPSVTLTANVTGTLTGTLTWAAVSGYSGSMPSVVTVTAAGAVGTATINAASMTADTATFSITLVDGTVSYSDTITLVKLRDGSDALTARLTNNSAGVSTSSAGVPTAGGFDAATGTMEVYRGATRLTSGVTYSVVSNPSGLSYSINASTGAYAVTGAGSWESSTMTASLMLRATVGSVTLDELFTLTKNLQGVSGLYKDYVFLRATSAPGAPSTASEPTTQGWSDTPTSGTDPLYMSSADRDVLTNVVSGAWTTPARLDGVAGTAGQYIEAQYAKNTSATTAPTTGWASTQPSLSTGEFMWMQTRTVVPPAAAPAWGTAVRISGEKGEPGNNGQNVVIVYAYRRSASALAGTASPGDSGDGSGGASSYTFSTKTLTLPTGTAWYANPPAGTDPLYVCAATASSATDSDSIAVGEWSDPVKLADNGLNGLNVATVFLYMRTTSSSAPDITSSGYDATYNFTSKALTSLPSSTGGTWTADVPATGGGYLWVSAATASSITSSDTIAYTEWSAARILSVNGVDGASAVVIDLSNDSHQIPTNTDGTGGNFYGASTTASIFLGGVDDSANWTWSCSRTNVTCSEASSSRTQTVTAIAADIGYIDFTATRSGYANQVARFSLVRVKGGAYVVQPSVDVVRKSAAGVYSPTSVTFSAKLMKADGSLQNYAGRFILATSTDGATFSTTYTSFSDEYTTAYTVPAGITHIRAQLYQSGGTSVMIDQEVIPVITDGAPGATAKTVTLVAESAVFKADSTNTVTTPDAIMFTVAKQNTSASVSWATSPSKTLYTAASGGSSTTSGDAVYLRKADFGTSASVVVTATCDGISDSATVLRVRDGDLTPQVAMSNPLHPMPCDSSGTVSSYSLSGTTLTVYEGSTQRNITAVSKSATGITAGTHSISVGVATVNNHTSMTADKATVEFTITYTKGDGTAGTAYATQSIVKQKAGATGSTGLRGSLIGNAAQYSISVSAWSDAKANRVIENMLTGASLTTDLATTTNLRLGDTVVMGNGTTFAAEKFWSGAAWLTPGQVINGNLLVTGSVAASAVNAIGLRVGSGGTIAATGYPGFSLDGSTPAVAGSDIAGARFGINPSGFAHVDTLLCWGQIYTSTFGAKAAVTSAIAYAENTSSGPGHMGKSASGNGGHFFGNATKGPVKVDPLGSLPSDKSEGQLCSVGGVLYYSNGSAWKIVNLT